MANVKISQLPAGTPTAESVIVGENAAGTTTEKYTLGTVQTLLSASFAGLVDGKIPSNQLPSYVDDVVEVVDFAALPATGETSKIYVTLDNNKTFRWSGSTYIEISAAAVSSVAGKTGAVTLDKNDVGLGGVDNTSDLNKPISTATQTALDLKAPIDSPTFTGTVSGVTKSMVGLGSVDNTGDADKPISTATQTALDLKAAIDSPTFTGTVGGITKSMVGLGNVDNTSDLNKPISTATQTALDLKAALTHNHDDRYYTETEIDAKLALLNGPIVKKFLLTSYTPSDSTPESTLPILLAQVDSAVIGVPVSAGKAMVGTVTVVAVNNATGGASMSRFVRHFSIKNISGTTALANTNGVATVGVDQKEDSTHAVTIKANNTADRLDIEVNSGNCTRWFAVVDAVEIDHTFATSACSVICCPHESTFDCATLTWSDPVVGTGPTQTVTDSSLIGSWTENGCVASVLVPCGTLPEDIGVYKPTFFPTQCCAMPLTGTVAQSGTPLCCGACVGSSASSAAAGACACDPQTIGGVSNVTVAPLTAPRLLNMTGGTNVVNLYASTGTMLDRLSVKSNGVDIADTTNGTDTANIDPGSTGFDVNLELCYSQTGTWQNPIGSQTTDYIVSADWDLLVYVTEAPLNDGTNNRPADTVSDIVFN